MRALLLITLCLSACSDARPDDTTSAESGGITADEIRERYAVAVCSAVADCTATPGQGGSSAPISYDACLRDMEQRMDQEAARGWPVILDEDRIEACEDFIASEGCWAPDNDVSYWRADDCNFGQ
jgi:hypothetical protein